LPRHDLRRAGLQRGWMWRCVWERGAVRLRGRSDGGGTRGARHPLRVTRERAVDPFFPAHDMHESDCNPTSALFTPDFFVSKRFNQQIRATCMDMFSGGGGPHLNEGKCKILCDVLQLNLDLSILMHLARPRSRPCMWWCAIHTAAQLFAVTH
jgi:hypothetical protein